MPNEQLTERGLEWLRHTNNAETTIGKSYAITSMRRIEERVAAEIKSKREVSRREVQSTELIGANAK